MGNHDFMLPTVCGLSYEFGCAPAVVCSCQGSSASEMEIPIKMRFAYVNAHSVICLVERGMHKTIRTVHGYLENIHFVCLDKPDMLHCDVGLKKSSRRLQICYSLVSSPHPSSLVFQRHSSLSRQDQVIDTFPHHHISNHTCSV